MAPEEELTQYTEDGWFAWYQPEQQQPSAYEPRDELRVPPNYGQPQVGFGTAGLPWQEGHSYDLENYPL